MIIKSFKIFESSAERLFSEMTIIEYDKIIVNHKFTQLTGREINDIKAYFYKINNSIKGSNIVRVDTPLSGIFEIDKYPNLKIWNDGRYEKYKIYLKKDEDEYFFIKDYSNHKFYKCDTMEGVYQFIEYFIKLIYK
jgi:hypothetical protein